MGAPGYTNDDMVMHGGLVGLLQGLDQRALRSAATTILPH